ncbi:hydroxymethylpyrimidine/phosphomethylpyrimidine kinase [Sphingobacterium arenae]|uniref:hydroxymethylpyrimidine kinase n=1 Tax=Sphingobacterium arenae TaxID=1280598 RepID=A0ABR7Y6K0_9SPHI|nr:hydroxymethylpyrimidine/phosphomethylpyrimidine kinase [Sphingobacterium arenae]MBD1426915.1 hydroxymethylpyrimidine/phosphomethylpyrimidine kinase [Sphingobacterium arenae]
MDKQKEKPIVLSIAGFDPCGGAGVLADIKTFEQLHVRGMAVLTANTVQTEDTFSTIIWADIDVVQKGIKELMQRYMISVVKIGIVRDTTFLAAILTSVYACNPEVFVIWDPVLKSSSGFTFFKADEMELLKGIIHKIDLLTPNFEEYQILEQLLKDYFPNALLIKGGHRKDQKGVDCLIQMGRATDFHPQVDRIYPKHGSGCVFSSAIAAHIACGSGLEEACRQAKTYIEQFLNSHPSLLGFHYHAE